MPGKEVRRTPTPRSLAQSMGGIDEVQANVLQASPYKFATVTILGVRGFTTDRTLPYGKRPDCTELRRGSLGGRYRVASPTERGENGAMRITPDRLDGTAQRDAARYMPRDTCRARTTALLPWPRGRTMLYAV